MYMLYMETYNRGGEEGIILSLCFCPSTYLKPTQFQDQISPLFRTDLYLTEIYKTANIQVFS